MKRILFIWLIILLSFSARAFAAGLSVVDVSPVFYEERPAIAVIFNAPIDPKGSYDDYISVVSSEDAVNVRGIADKDLQIIYYTGLKHDAVYNVSIKAGLKGKNGAVLNDYFRKEVKTNALTPSAWFSSPGMVAIPSSKAVLPVTVSNLDTILVTFYRAPANSNKNWFKGSANVSMTAYEVTNYMEGFKRIYSKSYGVDAINKQTSLNIELPKSFFESPGVYRAVIQGGNDAYNLSTTTFIISDLGLQVRKYQNGSWDIWARSLNTGEPLEGTSIKFVYKDEESEAGITDALGRLKISSLPHEGAYLIMAQRGRDMAIINAARPLDLSEHSISGPAFSKLQTFIYGPRDLCRGGETLRYNILVRDYDGRPADPGSVKIILTDPRGREADNNYYPLERNFGLYKYSYVLESGASTGVWKLEVRAGKNKTVHNFSVEDFMPETMKLTLGTPGEEVMVNKAKALRLQAQGEYLYGAPASGNKIEGFYDLRPGVYISDKWRDYRFAPEDVSLRFSNISLENRQLDDKGFSSWDISRDQRLRVIEEKLLPVRIKYFVTLYESGGRAVNRAKEYVYLPSGEALGIKTDYKDYASADEDNIFKVVNINHKGQAVKSRILVTLIKENRNYYWNYSPEEGWRSYYTSASYPVKSFEAETGEKPLEIPLRMDRGYYKLTVKNINTKQENNLNIRAGESWQFDDYDYGEDSGSGSGKAIYPESLTMVFDKPFYSAGSLAKITIGSPYDGKGMIFAETSDGILWSSKIEVKNKKVSVEIPVDKTWNRHDIYVSAYVARKEKELEKAQKGLVYGVIHLPLERLERKIDLEIISPDSVKPDKDFTIKVKARGRAVGKEGIMVTLAAVDQGVLSVKAFETPDPWAYFFGKKRYGGVVYDNFWQVIHKYSSKMAARYGGDAELMEKGGALARADVKIVSLFTDPIALDSNGEALIKLNIPSYNGELRLMAAAFSKDSFGSSESVLKVFEPVIAELAVPRFLGAGDKVSLALDTRNMTEVEQKLTVSVTASGSVDLVGGKFNETASLSKGQKKTFRIPVEARGSEGYGSVKVVVSGLKDKVEKTWRIATRPPYPALTNTHIVKIKPGEKAELYSGNFSEVIKNSAYLSVDLASVPPVGISSLFDRLLAYPYGCLEQTVSNTFPLVYASDEVRARYNMRLPGGKSRSELVEAGLARLYGKQLRNGGFGYWDASSHESAWGTVYAAEMMNESKKRGFSVNKNSLAKANDRLAEYLRKDVDNPYYSYYDYERHYKGATKAYAAYVLAKYAAVSLADIRNVYSQYGGDIKTPVPFIHLAVALKISGDREKAEEAFKKGAAMLSSSWEGYFGDYSSPLREKAWSLSLFKEYNGKLSSDWGERFVETAYSALDSDWLSTQEQLRLLGAALSVPSGEPVKGVFAYGGKEEKVKGEVYGKTWRGEELSQGVTFSSSNDTDLFAKTDFIAYPLSAPDEINNNASVRRDYFDTEGYRLNMDNIKAGDFVVVRLTYKAGINTADGLLVDLIPAGFEIENQNIDNSLKLSSVKLPGEANAKEIYSETRDDRFIAAVNLRKDREFSLFYIMRAVTPGEYSNPTPYFEDMYRPHVRALGQALPERVRVLPK